MGTSSTRTTSREPWVRSKPCRRAAFIVPYMNEVSWSNGVMEYWSNGLRAHHSNTPLLHHSSFPVTRSLFLSGYTTEPWSPCCKARRLWQGPIRRSDEFLDPRLRIRSDFPLA